MNSEKISIAKVVLVFTVLMLIFSSGLVLSQDTNGRDSVIVETAQDTVLIKSYAARYSPRKALLFAAVLPGLGQIYTKKYWKLPLVYGGFASLGYAINFYQKGYKTYKNHLFYNIEHGNGNENYQNPNTPYPYTTATLRTIVDKYRRERDFFVIMMGGMYLLQIIDAHVDAHLKEFDLNPRLQVSIEPRSEQDAILGRQSGFAIVMKF
jgi:hypothetical protein